jgi:PqqD family protein of HPr-rel-A system
MRVVLQGARVEWTQDGDAFLFEERYGFAYILNDTAALLLERLLRGDCSEDELVEILSDQFEATAGDDLRGDVQRFLVQLRAYGLLL